MDELTKGISRFEITDPYYGRGAERMVSHKPYWEVANELYRNIWNSDLDRPLLQGEETIKCTKAESISRYDSALGVDAILRSAGYGKFTLQEKFLQTDRTTVTIEHCQDFMTLEPGDWYTSEVQYYFVGYVIPGILKFQRWILLDWVALHRVSINWHLNANFRDKVGAKASFIYAEFDEMPDSVVMAASKLKTRMLLESAK